jgi:hypothetical protein
LRTCNPVAACARRKVVRAARDGNLVSYNVLKPQYHVLLLDRGLHRTAAEERSTHTHILGYNARHTFQKHTW